METGLSKNLRTHIVYIKTVDGKDVEEIQITKEQYNMISDDIANMKITDFYTITDIDTGKILFEGQRKDILRFKEKNISGGSGYQVFCDYGNKHDLINGGIQCDCGKNYGYLSIDLKVYCRDKYKIIYSSDITSDMRKEFYLYLKDREVLNELPK